MFINRCYNIIVLQTFECTFESSILTIYSVLQHNIFSFYQYRLLSILKRFSKIYYQALQNLGFIVIDYLKLFACIFTNV